MRGSPGGSSKARDKAASVPMNNDLADTLAVTYDCDSLATAL
jgi:hypothetical protein